MSAPTPAPGDDRPREGYYPDPSIPGYVRYWNGASWVPGTSRPAPKDGEPLVPPPGIRPAAPATPAPSAVEETGPHFFDEDPQPSPSGQEAGVAWPADGQSTGQPGAWAADGQGAGQSGGWSADGQGGGQPGGWSADGQAGQSGAGAGGPQGQGGSGGRHAGQAGAGGDGRAPWADDPRVPAAGPAQRSGRAETPPAEGDAPDNGGTFIFRRPVPGPAAVTDDGTMTFRPVPGQARPSASGAQAGPGSGSGPQASGAGADATSRPDTGFGPGAAGQGAGAAGSGGASGGFPSQASGAGAGGAGQGAAGGFGPQGAGAGAGAAGGGGGFGPQASGAGAGGAGQGAGGGFGPQGPVGAPHPQAGGASSVPSPAAGPGFGAGKAAAERAAAGQAGPAPSAPFGAQSAQPAPSAPSAVAPSVPAQAGAPAAPVTSGPGGGQASWAQQVHQLAGGDEQPVAPWKPPVEDVFQAAARRQAAARPAGLGKRLAARLIDTLIVGLVTAGIAAPLGLRAADHIREKIDAAKLSGREVTVWLLDGTTATSLGIVLAVLLLVGVGYEVLPTAKWGRTLGKRLFGLEVRDIEAHEPPTFGPALRRWLVYSIPGLLGIGIVGVLWCLFDRPWHQCWHDKAAHTFVAG
ncbi:RDD family protein [Streptomyces sp. CoH27]|uniref:RDD family protein n=1 Tax=Streptomyces sp. CoH27 TaxID=2875763 RepID=UPI001CD3852F|nr:RDD family protein [Streptomyces sp. CoH27]